MLSLGYAQDVTTLPELGVSTTQPMCRSKPLHIQFRARKGFLKKSFQTEVLASLNAEKQSWLFKNHIGFLNHIGPKPIGMIHAVNPSTKEGRLIQEDCCEL